MTKVPRPLFSVPKAGQFRNGLYSGRHASPTPRATASSLQLAIAIPRVAARLINGCKQTVGLPAACIEASTDPVTVDLFRKMRSGQTFSASGLPDVRIEETEDRDHLVKIPGLDVFNPVAMDSDLGEGNDVPAWSIDTDYNGSCVHACQAFFPRTSAWEGLKRSL